MHILISRYPSGCNRWGVFSNVLDRADRLTGNSDALPFGLWYLHFHAPWLRIELYATVDGPTFSYLGPRRYVRFLSTRRLMIETRGAK